MDKEIVRRIIRKHKGEVQRCYESGLVWQPELTGREIVRFTIAATGRVIDSFVESSTLNSPSVERCIADAVRGWEFPKPTGGGIVIVTYPFLLQTLHAETQPRGG